MTRADEVKKLKTKIEERIGISIADIRFYATGQNTNLYLVDLDDRRRIMAKVIRKDVIDLTGVDLEVEGWMLTYLSMKTKLPVPKVHWYDQTTILMDFIEDSGGIDNAVESNAAHALADLHNIRSDFFGLERDTAIALFNQPNHFELKWVDFFRQYRLLHTAHSAFNQGVIDSALMKNIQKLAEKLESYIDQPSIPGLIHGDLWSGNIMLGPGQVRAFLDPALYYADPEMELAAIYTHGTFGEHFFKAYNEIRPIQPGFEVRRDIYGLYPLLLHGRLGYASQIERVKTIVERLVG